MMRAVAPWGDERPVLVTGGAGFIGCNLASRLAEMGRTVLVLDALSRPGVEENLAWLRRRHGDLIQPVIADIRDSEVVARSVAESDAVFHFAAQVAVTTSLSDPREDHDINIGGTLNVLEAARAAGRGIPVVFASTNKVYGDLGGLELNRREDRYEPANGTVARHGVPAAQPLSFHTPYGCSKGAADQYVLDYARSYGVPTVVMRMSCIYGPRQFGTEDQGWVAHFLIRCLEGKPVMIYGDGRQVRDVLYVEDAVAAYLAAWREIDRCAGRAFNLGGGPDNAVSLLDVLAQIRDITGRNPRVEFGPWREGDQRYYVSDVRETRASLGLAPFVDWREGLARLAAWLAQARRPSASDAAARGSHAQAGAAQ